MNFLTRWLCPKPVPAPAPAPKPPVLSGYIAVTELGVEAPVLSAGLEQPRQVDESTIVVPVVPARDGWTDFVVTRPRTFLPSSIAIMDLYAGSEIRFTFVDAVTGQPIAIPRRTAFLFACIPLQS